jgi:predicted hotdog family 3-hydroxylacyl-ACP dehydratase
MCLLDSVRCWSGTEIVCIASSHRDTDHPLATDGFLNSVCGIEYAAQAMAVHGGLIAASGRRPASGYLASVRDVTCHIARLDLLADDIEVSATQLASDAAGAVYAFVLRCGTVTIIEGRAAVVIDAGNVSAAASPT